MGRTVGVILAAGQGKRMKSDLLKVLHPVGGLPMVEHVLAALTGAGVDRSVAVVAPRGDGVRRVLGNRVDYAVQERALGTGHALLQAKDLVEPDDDLVVLYGDTPLLTAAILGDLLRRHRGMRAAATLLTVELPDPRGYGRIVRDAAGRLLRIVEEADADGEVRAIREVNAGIYCFRAGEVFAALERVRPENTQGEYYLVDVFPLLLARGRPVEAVRVEDRDALRGINTRADLAAAEAALRRRVVQALWAEGVTIVDPASTYIDVRVRAGRDTVILPFTVLEGDSEIGEGCRIGPGAHVRDSRIGDGARVFHAVVEDCRVEAGAEIGPFVHLKGRGRPPSGR